MRARSELPASGSVPADGASRAAVLATALFLFAATLWLYWPATRFAFLTIDDGSYVYANPNVRRGLSWDGTVWAFTRSYSSNWHPLTWLSHMLDAELFRMDAGAHHRTSIVLHAASAALLFLALRALRLGTLAAAFVAALFAWHPLRVESVAWVAERKDVLAGLFLTLVLLAWARYARAPSPARYALVALLFALGLMAKPMLVTLPGLLLLVDLWPLARARALPVPAPRAGPARASVPPQRSLAALALEKLPLFLLAAASCAVTVVVQARSGAVRSLVQLSFADRLSNALTSVWVYVAKTLWPATLATFYPHPAIVTPLDFRPWSAPVLAAACGLGAVTLLALVLVRRAPFLFVGWAWFLGMLLPVIGLVQVGEQAYADRYTYLPTIGLGLVVAGAASALGRARPAAGVALALALGALLVPLALRTRTALEPWVDSETLFRHALSVTERNYVAHFNLGVTYEAQGRAAEAREEYRSALAIKPDSADAHYNLGVLLRDEGDLRGAEAHLRDAIRRRPNRVAAHVNLGVTLAEAGRPREAEESLQRALALQPESAEAWTNLGAISAQEEDWERARERFERALAIDPQNVGARFQLGVVALKSGAPDEARRAFEETLRRAPEHPGARRWLQVLDAAGREGGG